MQPSVYTRVEPILLPHFPRLFYLVLREQGFDDAQIFKGLDLDPSQLNTMDYRLSIEQHEQFILRMLELTDNPHFALEIFKANSSSFTSLPMMAIANSGQISKAMNMIARYNKILTRVFTVEVNDALSNSCMNIDVHVEHERVIYFAVTSFALYIAHFFDEIDGGSNIVEHLELTVAKPQGFEKVQAQFPFELSFGKKRCAIFLDPKSLDRPMRQADPQTVSLLTEMAEQQLREAESEFSVAGALKVLLMDQIAAPPGLEEAARMLGVSSRGLRRKLAESGTTYQRMLDSVRLALASRLISETTTPIAEIGYELGFSNPSDFARAFKKWTGQSPSIYRQNH